MRMARAGFRSRTPGDRPRVAPHVQERSRWKTAAPDSNRGMLEVTRKHRRAGTGPDCLATDVRPRSALADCVGRAVN